jgi:hypothetical protein
LETGVAAIYQNNWVESVLCKVEEYPADDTIPYHEVEDEKAVRQFKTLVNLKKIPLCNLGISAEKLEKQILEVDISTFKMLDARYILALFPHWMPVFKDAYEKAGREKTQLSGLRDYIVEHLSPSLKGFPKEYNDYILTCIINAGCKNKPAMHEVPELWENFIMKEQSDAERII